MLFRWAKRANNRVRPGRFREHSLDDQANIRLCRQRARVGVPLSCKLASEAMKNGLRPRRACLAIGPTTADQIAPGIDTERGNSPTGPGLGVPLVDLPKAKAT